MSRYSVIPEEGIGPGGDIVFRRHPAGTNWYKLCVGDKYLGEVIKGFFGEWTAISHGNNSEFFPEVNSMEGFATRLAAATFIIKHHGYWMRYERDFHARLKDFEQKFNQS